MGPCAQIPDVANAHALALRVTFGDTGAEDRLVGLFAENVMAYVLTRVRRREIAEELTDDVLMASLIALRLGRVRDPSRIGAFIHGVARHVVGNHFKRRRGQPWIGQLRHDVAGASDSCETSGEEQRQLVRDALAELESLDRTIMRMLLDEGATNAEIAARLGLKAATVRQHKCRIVRRLARRLRSSP